MARKCPPGVLCLSSPIVICIVILLMVYMWSTYQRPTYERPTYETPTYHPPIESRYDIAPQPINIPTRGIPDSFQSMGVINIDEKILPIYGRRINSDRWNYYTRTDTYNPVPIPIRYQKRDCMDDIGCQEIMTGDEVKVDAMNKHGKVNIYKYGAPKYIGFI